MAENNDLQVDINEVLAVTQRRLQEVLTQTVMMEAFINQLRRENTELREALDKMGEEIGNNTDG